MIQTTLPQEPISRPAWSQHLPISLRRIFPLASFVGCADIRVFDATSDSRQCSSNVLFAALRGTQTDGLHFVADAVRQGAGALLVERPVAGAAVPQCVVPHTRKAYAEVCDALEGRPSRHLTVAGVTGTNGKSTVTWLVRSILNAAGLQTGVLGTIHYSDGVRTEASRLTTPDSRTLAGWLGDMVRRKTTHAAVELSSHALDQDRTAAMQLDAAIVTNVTQDHFDYHRDFETYLASKGRIFGQLTPRGTAVLNADDAACRTLGQRIAGQWPVVTYGLSGQADLRAQVTHESLSGSRFLVHRADDSPVEVFTPLIGRHNVSNCLAAAAACRHFGVAWEAITDGIEALESVPGRLERIDSLEPFDLFVDYAHTDDALRRCLICLHQLSRGRVICVFGAGGDRDRTKRPLLARAASLADIAVVTSDNPRTEDPRAIIEDVLAGFSKTGKQPHVEPDRADAIRWALERARPGDCVLIAGKGHETEQIIGTERFPFDDREVARRCLVHPAHLHPLSHLPNLV